MMVPTLSHLIQRQRREIGIPPYSGERIGRVVDEHTPFIVNTVVRRTECLKGSVQHSLLSNSFKMWHMSPFNESNAQSIASHIRVAIYTAFVRWTTRRGSRGEC
jgi:hypothetical protein